MPNTTIKSMGIEHMNADHRENPSGLIKGKTMHLTMYVPNLISLDIEENFAELKYQQKLTTTPRVKENLKLIKQGRRWIKNGRKT